MSINQFERELLIACREVEGEAKGDVYVFEGDFDHPQPYVVVGNKEFREEGNPEKAARYCGAVKTLVEKGILELTHQSQGATVYSLTSDGWDLIGTI